MNPQNQSEYLLPGEYVSQRGNTNMLNSTITREVQVINVVNPLFFFVKLENEVDYYYALKQSIAIFYGPGGQGSRLQLSPHMLRPYLYTVVNYCGIWIRFLIFNVTFATQSVVGMSVDFGKALTLDMTEYAFYPLHRLFASLPPQAIHCKLFNVVPVRKKGWEFRSLELLNGMTSIEKKLGAIFIKLEKESTDTYEVILVDISNKNQPFFIVQKMIEAGCLKMKHKKSKS